VQLVDWSVAMFLLVVIFNGVEWDCFLQLDILQVRHLEFSTDLLDIGKSDGPMLITLTW
jgi:hypothetical protein